MGGLLLLVALVVWFLVVVWGAKALALRLAPEPWRALIALALVVVLLPVPVADEIVARRQFKQLCDANSTVLVDRVTAVGKKVYLAEVPFVDVEGPWVRVVRRPYRFVDVKSGETVVSWNEFGAVGGIFFRNLTEGGVPMLFKGSCYPGEIRELRKLFSDLHIELIPRDKAKQ
jgi:hypothetical protein